MAHQFPIELHSVVNLVEKGINKESCHYGNLSMESSKYISLKDTGSDGSAQLVVVYVDDDNNVTRKPMKAEASIMHPTENLIVLRAKTDQAGHFVQVYNFDSKEKLGTHQFAEPIGLWKWVTKRTLGVVTSKSVYHWEVDSKTAPTKIFDRSGKLAESGIQLMNYTVDDSLKWAALTGLAKEGDPVAIYGTTLLYSIERKQSRVLDTHAACFGELMVDSKRPVLCFIEKKKDASSPKLLIMDIFTPREEGGVPPLKVSGDVEYTAEQGNDFPISVHLSKSYGVLYLLTKNGFLMLFDPVTATLLFRHRISQESLFASCYNEKTGGVYAVNRGGLVLSATISEQTFIPFIQNSLAHVANRQQIALGFAKRYGLPGADDLLIQVFSQHFAKGEYQQAARIVGLMKSGALRNSQVLDQFKTAAASPGQPSPILTYFQALLETGKLNALESKEIVIPIVAQGRREFIEKWLKDDQLECTEELGDIVKPLDGKLSLSIYLRANASPKVVQSFVEQGQYEQIVAYCNKVNYQADFTTILRNIVAINPEGTAVFCQKLLDQDPPLVDINQVIDILSQQSRLQELTSILLEYLKTDRADQGHIQTRLLELNLLNSPKVAEAIFQIDKYTHFDKPKIALLCEKAGLYQRALEYYTDVIDIKRIMTHTGSQFSVEWMQQFFGKLPPDASLEIMTDMLRSNRQNMNTVVSMAIKFHEQIGTGALIKMFESFSSYEGIFYFLGFVLSSNQDPDVHFKYIEAASKLNHIQEVERCCRESTFYDPIRVKDFLKQAKLADPRPLICVCDLHHFVDEMTEYLYKNGLMKYIEVYVLKVNSKNAPIVIGTLIDLDCPEDFVDSLLVSIRGMCPVGSLIEEMEKRNRLRILLPWLEARMNEGNQETELHNAVAKIYIDTNRDPEQFLKNNAYYDSKIVGKYCEDRDPHLAFTCYKRAWGTCDAELVEVTNVNGLFRLQARYLVERRSPELWLAVLSQETEYRRSVIDQVVSTALPESTNAEEISVAVKAFIAAKLPNELIDLLEKIVLHNSDFSSYKNLQNLLILTAVSARPAKVMDYINRLENYDGTHIARLAAENGLFEEAFQIYKKFEMNGEAIEVLLKNSENLERASDFAAKCNLSYVWSKLASQQLAGGFVSDAIDSYLRAEDGSNYKDVIEVSKQCSAYEQLVKYLQMARIPNKDQLIDSELVYALAKCDHLIEMAEFVGGSNTANVQTVGDRLFEEEHFEAAKKLYGSIPNHSKMAICYVRLGDFLSAVEAAKKANSPKTWKEVSFACVEAKEFKCAHTAGLNLIIHPDHLDELIMQYEYRGMFDDLIVLLEAGIASDRTHVGMFTEMGIAYVKYKPEKLMEFCRLHCGRINISKLIRVCERHLQWKPAVYLHVFYDECDQAIALMMAHNSCAFEHEEFLKVIQKISNSDLYYQAITFYHDFYPMQLHSLLKTLEKKLDPSKVVSIGKNLHCLPLIEEYLLEVQHTNLIPVNETINELLLESCNFDRLRQSVSTFTNFDQIATAKRLQDHSSLEVRRISALLYQLNKRYKDSLDVSLGDKQYQDAMITVAASASSSLVEELLRFFTEHDQINCFTACLQICYDFVKPDVAIEMAWKKGWTDAAMPYTIQIIHEFSNRLDILDKKEEIREKKEEKQKSAPNDFLPDMMGGPMLPGMGNLALMPPPFQGQQMQPPSTSFVDSMQPRQPMFNMNNFQTSNFTPPRYH